MSATTSRPEGLRRIFSTVSDKPPKRVSTVDEELTDHTKGNLALRGLEAGPGIALTLQDADNKSMTRGKKILISATSENKGLERYDVVVSDNQKAFTMPTDVTEVILMSINGIENVDFTFNQSTHTLIYNATFYNVEQSDVVFFMYRS